MSKKILLAKFALPITLYLLHNQPLHIMKNIFLLLTCIFAITINFQSQNPLVKHWDKRFWGADSDIFTQFTQTTDGGYILGNYCYCELMVIKQALRGYRVITIGL